MEAKESSAVEYFYILAIFNYYWSLSTERRETLYTKFFPRVTLQVALIDISQFPKGMYLISVKTEEQNLESQFLKQ